MILLAFAHARYRPLLMFGFIGLANVVDDAGVYSALQQVIPPRSTGRAMGVRRAVLLLSMGLGSAVTPVLIHAWGTRGTLLATGLLLVVVAASSVPSLTAIDRKIAAPGPDFALLRRVPFFGPLVCESRAPGQRTAVGDLRARGRYHPGRGARRTLLPHRTTSGPRQQGWPAAQRDGPG
jgi:MFS family permease